MGAVATPLELVLLLAVIDPENVPLGPVPGAVNVTEIPLTGFPLASFTVACSAAKLLPAVALCGVPALAVMLPLAKPSAAAFRVTFPVPEIMVQVTVNVCDAEPAL